MYGGKREREREREIERKREKERSEFLLGREGRKECAGTLPDLKAGSPNSFH
jgi:hypothetical protein